MPSRLWNMATRLAAGSVLLLGVAAAAQADFIVFSDGGTSDPGSIQDTVDAFRGALGDPNNANAPGPLTEGRREINWDGGGASTATSSGTPFAGFADTRGALFATPGSGFLQSPLDDVALLGLDPGYETTFSFFSPLRIFTPLGSNITDVSFFVPGTGVTVPAVVSGFGAIFSDVDLAGVTSLQLFDVDGVSMGLFNVVPGLEPSGSLSFLGVLADAGEEIARVRITTGNAALGLPDTNGNPVDIVVMDDFLYSEPVAPQGVPEPASLLLMLAGLAGAFLVRDRRARSVTAPTASSEWPSSR